MGQPKILPQLSELKKVHIIGVCGTLMAPFAAFLKRSGVEVTGSDQNVYPPMSDLLQNAGVELFSGYKPENIQGMKRKPDLVVIGNVISASNPEARAVIDGGLPYTSLPEAMENLLLRDTQNLVVAGTHGKTTTSSLLAHVFASCGKNPSYFIGGVSLDLPFSFNVTGIGKGSYFVLEGDEYDTAFWDKVPKFNHYLPDHVILTSVEFDHADIYADFAAVERAFAGLLARIRKGGSLIACYDFPAVKKLVETVQKTAAFQILTYGGDAAQGARFYPGKIQSGPTSTRFEVMEAGKAVDEVTINLSGKHNVMNALAVWIQSRERGLKMPDVRVALAQFKGVKRRQEVRGEVGGVLVIDDFAHHPTAVRETLRALKQRYPTRRLVTVFEPRSATSRRKVFQKDYAEAFSEADTVFISVPYDQSKINADDQFSSDQLVGDLQKMGKSANLMQSVEAGVAAVANQSRAGDLVVVLSNGGFGGFIGSLLSKLGSL